MPIREPSLAVNRGVQPYRVLLVDDSAVIRGLLARFLQDDPQIKVEATAGNGEQALGALKRYDIDVIVLDIEMPVMDGLTALPKILEIDPKAKVIIASTLSQHNAEVSLQALQAGATDYIPKPSATSGISKGVDFQRELVQKIKTLGRAYRVDSGGPVEPARPLQSAGLPSGETEAVAKTKPAIRPAGAKEIAPKAAEVIAIGSSTGGPQALLSLFRDLDPDVQLPILITQHMPPTFTSILAQHIAKASGRLCAEGVEGTKVERGHIYLAPGDWHMVVRSDGGKRVIHLNQDPPVNFCRPAVDPLFCSVAEVYDGRVLAVVLTGMGQDGLVGGEDIVRSGGTVIAQDEASSVVWGMPGAVAEAGLCSAVLPLSKMAGYIAGFPKRSPA